MYKEWYVWGRVSWSDMCLMLLHSDVMASCPPQNLPGLTSVVQIWIFFFVP